MRMIGLAKSMMVVVLIAFSGGFGIYSFEMPVSNSQSLKYKFPHLGLYHIHGKALPGFGTFYECELDLLPGYDADSVRADENGNLPIDGALFITPAEFRAGTKTEQRGDMNSSGEVSFVNVIRLKFVSAKLQLEGNRFAKINFVTQPVDGTSYSFDGAFLAEPKLEKGSYVELAGNLRKLKDGRKVAEANLKFLRWAHE
jgi:hypothetical protein